VIHVDETSFLVITGVAAVAALTVAVLPRHVAPPVVVLELLLGILVGPDVLDLAQSDGFTTFFSNLGLRMLFLIAMTMSPGATTAAARLI
jgi:Kef-type K+ transport system membrane component KefB